MASYAFNETNAERIDTALQIYEAAACGAVNLNQAKHN